MVEFSDLDEVWMVVMLYNLYKKKKMLFEDIYCLIMVCIVLEDYLKLKVSNIEFDFL